MDTVVLDQASSETRLHRVLHLVKFQRALVLNALVAGAGFALYFTLGIHGLYPPLDDVINAIEALADEAVRAGQADIARWLPVFVFGMFIVVALMVLWFHFALVKVWRWNLRIQSAALLILGLNHLGQQWSVVSFSLDHLPPGYSAALAITFAMVDFVIIDTIACLWTVSFAKERSSFTAVSDRRLARTRAAYINKILDLPRSALKNRRVAAAYLVSLVAAFLIILAIVHILNGGSIEAKAAQLKPLCRSDPGACDAKATTLLIDSVVGVAIAFAGLRLAALLQSYAKRLGGLSVSDVVGEGEQGFVLYLRPFDVDHVLLPKPRLPLLGRLMTFRPYPARLEEELFDVADGYRPLIAVGEPGGGRAQTGGLAHRIYLADDEWQSYVRDKIRRAESIVIVLKNTPGVHWEAEQIIEQGAARKTLFFFAPEAADPTVWTGLCAAFLPSFERATLIAPGTSFRGQPIAFFLQDDRLVEISNTHWTTTSYRTAASSFLADRAAGNKGSFEARSATFRH